MFREIILVQLAWREGVLPNMVGRFISDDSFLRFLTQFMSQLDLIDPLSADKIGLSLSQLVLETIGPTVGINYLSTKCNN